MIFDLPTLAADFFFSGQCSLAVIIISVYIVSISGYQDLTHTHTQYKYMDPDYIMLL